MFTSCTADSFDKERTGMRCILRSIFLASTLALLSAACQAQVFRADLSGPAESPPNSSPGTGTSIITLDLSGNTLRVQTVFSGLLGTTTASHIHSATAVPFTGTAGVATQVPTFSAFPLGVTSGSMD